MSMTLQRRFFKTVSNRGKLVTSLDKYLKNLSSPTPQQQTPPKTPTPQASKTPQDYASERRASSSTGLRGPRPPSISSPRTSFSKNPASPSVEDLKNDLSYPFERKMNLNDSSPVAKSAQNLKNAVGMTASRPPPPVKAKPANLSRSSSVTSNDAFESSLARGKPLPPAHPKAVTQPKVSTQPSINPPPSSTEVPVPSPSSPSPSANEKVSVPNPLYSSILCAGCSKPISGVVISAMNKRWHASCFKCKECGENLEHMAYQEKDGVPYCALDFHEKFSVKCDYCHTPIEEVSCYEMFQMVARVFLEYTDFCPIIEYCQCAWQALSSRPLLLHRVWSSF